MSLEFSARVANRASPLGSTFVAMRGSPPLSRWFWPCWFSPAVTDGPTHEKTPKPTTTAPETTRSERRLSGLPSDSRRSTRLTRAEPELAMAAADVGVGASLSQVPTRSKQRAKSTPLPTRCAAQSSAANSVSSSRCTMVQRSKGWNHASATARRQAPSQMGSRRTRWPISWASRASSCAGSSSATAFSGSTISLRPMAMGVRVFTLWVRRRPRPSSFPPGKLRAIFVIAESVIRLRLPSNRHAARSRRTKRRAPITLKSTRETGTQVQARSPRLGPPVPGCTVAAFAAAAVAGATSIPPGCADACTEMTAPELFTSGSIHSCPEPANPARVAVTKAPSRAPRRTKALPAGPSMNRTQSRAKPVSTVEWRRKVRIQAARGVSVMGSPFFD